MTRSQLAAVLAVAALLALVAIAPAPAAGQTDSDSGGPLLFGVGETAVADDWQTQARHAFEVFLDRSIAQLNVVNPLAEETSADAYAEEIQSCAAPTDDDLAWLNTHASGYNLSAYDDVTLVVEGDDEATERLYLDAAHAGGNLTDVTISETDDSDPTDWTVTLDNYATEHVCQDHRWVRNQYVDSSDAPDKQAAARLGARYYGHVDYAEGSA